MRLKVKFFRSNGQLNISDIVNFVRSRKGIFQPIRSKCIVSEVHLASAIERSLRRSENGSRIRDPGILILMYLSGSDQIQDAMEQCGIQQDCASFAVVYEDDSDISDFLHAFQYISENDLPIPHDHSNDMIFERMSYVDSILD
ncbi:MULTISPECIES: KEOPS complex subunit Cgi121 [unclassified Thermoplasma]|uniref:KEOPS complex subunit Cgi121 n=1 Tax=unclassified Thermoplasma TaxID=2684908 RepID=UPI000D9E83B8|nr:MULTISPECIES: KEOPS complex subunit Cgi121 [unclassified Thermoplasma]PYB67932.1 hypothetical protein DMB44_06465 [Thermoplasma sp. Kam2015]